MSDAAGKEESISIGTGACQQEHRPSSLRPLDTARSWSGVSFLALEMVCDDMNGEIRREKEETNAITERSALQTGIGSDATLRIVLDMRRSRTMATICEAVGSGHESGIRRAVLERRQQQLVALGSGVILLEALFAGQTGLLGLGEVSVGGDEGCALSHVRTSTGKDWTGHTWQLLLRRGRGCWLARGLVCEESGCVYELDEGLPVDVVFDGGGEWDDVGEQWRGRIRLGRPGE